MFSKVLLIRNADLCKDVLHLLNFLKLKREDAFQCFELMDASMSLDMDVATHKKLLGFVDIILEGLGQRAEGLANRSHLDYLEESESESESELESESESEPESESESEAEAEAGYGSKSESELESEPESEAEAGYESGFEGVRESGMGGPGLIVESNDVIKKLFKFLMLEKVSNFLQIFVDEDITPFRYKIGIVRFIAAIEKTEDEMLVDNIIHMYKSMKETQDKKYVLCMFQRVLALDEDKQAYHTAESALSDIKKCDFLIGNLDFFREVVKNGYVGLLALFGPYGRIKVRELDTSMMNFFSFPNNYKLARALYECLCDKYCYHSMWDEDFYDAFDASGCAILENAPLWSRALELESLVVVVNKHELIHCFLETLGYFMSSFRDIGIEFAKMFYQMCNDQKRNSKNLEKFFFENLSKLYYSVILDREAIYPFLEVFKESEVVDFVDFLRVLSHFSDFDVCKKQDYLHNIMKDIVRNSGKKKVHSNLVEVGKVISSDIFKYFFRDNQMLGKHLLPKLLSMDAVDIQKAAKITKDDMCSALKCDGPKGDDDYGIVLYEKFVAVFNDVLARVSPLPPSKVEVLEAGIGMLQGACIRDCGEEMDVNPPEGRVAVKAEGFKR